MAVVETKAYAEPAARTDACDVVKVGADTPEQTYPLPVYGLVRPVAVVGRRVSEPDKVVAVGTDVGVVVRFEPFCAVV